MDDEAGTDTRSGGARAQSDATLERIRGIAGISASETSVHLQTYRG